MKIELFFSKEECQVQLIQCQKQLNQMKNCGGFRLFEVFSLPFNLLVCR